MPLLAPITDTLAIYMYNAHEHKPLIDFISHKKNVFSTSANYSRYLQFSFSTPLLMLVIVPYTCTIITELEDLSMLFIVIQDSVQL